MPSDKARAYAAHPESAALKDAVEQAGAPAAAVQRDMEQTENGRRETVHRSAGNRDEAGVHEEAEPVSSTTERSSVSMPAGASGQWPLAADDPFRAHTLDAPGAEELSPNRAPDAARGDPPYIDPSEDLMRVGATTGIGASIAPGAWGSHAEEFRRRWQAEHAPEGGENQWEGIEPGFRYGFEKATEGQYFDREWDAVRNDLAAEHPEWVRNNNLDPDTHTWHQHEQPARDAWTYVRNRR